LLIKRAMLSAIRGKLNSSLVAEKDDEFEHNSHNDSNVFVAMSCLGPLLTNVVFEFVVESGADSISEVPGCY
jgi:hypothetical protein